MLSISKLKKIKKAVSNILDTALLKKQNYFPLIESNSTSKIRVEFASIFGPAARSP